MTKAEKIVEEYVINQNNIDWTLIDFVHQVADRTRKDFALRCRNKFGYSIGSVIQSVVDDESFKWEDEEIEK